MKLSSENSQPSPTIKFLYSYGGKILPRKSDGKLRYAGGHTRILTVDRSISYAELIVKFWDACGSSMTLRCKLPSEDLDVLVSVSSDEDLRNVIEEYDRTGNRDFKVRAILDPLQSVKKISPSPSVVDFTASPPPMKKFPFSKPVSRYPVVDRYPVPGFYPVNLPTAAAMADCRSYSRLIARNVQFVPRWNYRQL